MTAPSGTIFTRPTVTNLRRELRAASPLAERLLWAQLKGRKLGVKFRRQHSVGPYVVDFFCKELNLAIEIDGPSHHENEEVERYDLRLERHVGANPPRQGNGRVPAGSWVTPSISQRRVAIRADHRANEDER